MIYILIIKKLEANEISTLKSLWCILNYNSPSPELSKCVYSDIPYSAQVLKKEKLDRKQYHM